ncbi:MAG: penicillin-binding protein 1A [Alphaproteobacteria bacterium]
MADKSDEILRAWRPASSEPPRGPRNRKPSGGGKPPKPPRKPGRWRWLRQLVIACLFLGLAGGLMAGYLIWHFARDLPDYSQLETYEPPIATRVYAGDGRLVAEFATEKRVFTAIDSIPKVVIDAFLAAEDSEFYTHRGVNFFSMVRAALQNVGNLADNRRPVGASTITQQVAKNFLLSNELSIARKVKEVVLATRIEKALSKKRILELYLNEIYLGYGAYGVAAAAGNYFGKSLDELTVPEAAYLAALPKAPSNYHPIRNPQAAVARRNWVIERMRDERFITPEVAQKAEAAPLGVRLRDDTDIARADYYAEEVRRILIGKYGEDSLYRGGLAVRTSLDPRFQAIADRVLRTGLRAYDRRHGWRGPIGTMDISGDWAKRLNAHPPVGGLSPWRLALVLSVANDHAEIGFGDGTKAKLAMSEMAWARKSLPEAEVGPSPKTPSEVVKPGDLIAVEGIKKDNDTVYALRQIPLIQGAIVALDPHTGRVLAMSGGYSQDMSMFNRATQAKRQPGSAFKPFVYLAALDAGLTPSTRILDAPIVIDQGPGLPKWKPENYTQKFYGPAPMRIGIEQSRNLMTVRLAQTVGMDKVADAAERFGVVDKLQQTLANSLGATETTLLRLTAAYAMIDNGGKKITPTFIDRVQDRYGKTLFRADQRVCNGCGASAWNGQPPPSLPDTRAQIGDPVSAYQMVSMMEGVVQRGTGARIAELRRSIAGKTGTTNESMDTWFVGFSANLAVGVFVGFDHPATLGKKEQGASVAVPIFKEFMAEALKDKPDVPFRVPPGVSLVRVNHDTGQLARPGDRVVILEAFRAGTGPGESATLMGMGTDDTGSGTGSSFGGAGSATSTGTGGLY